MCARFCNFETVHVQVGVFTVVCVGEKLGYNCCFTLLLVSCCNLSVFTVYIVVWTFNAQADKKRKKSNNVCQVVLKLQEFIDISCIPTAHIANAWCWARQQHRTPSAKRVNRGVVLGHGFIVKKI